MIIWRMKTKIIKCSTVYGFLGWLILAFSASQQKRSINCPFSSGLVVEKLSRTPESPIPNDVSFSYKNEPWNGMRLKICPIFEFCDLWYLPETIVVVVRFLKFPFNKLTLIFLLFSFSSSYISLWFLLELRRSFYFFRTTAASLFWESNNLQSHG